ncbi:hypothetical protein [Anaerosporobacter sp.]|uniref:hypothetical protein n=1 Tax=Anaerosporobacter sp. TaxID=1872529 RepID=UPI0028A18459|nr:hypothetical protein [Anaerosporobacter sp.]
MKQVNLEKFAGGALSQQVSRAINQVMRNMQDVNTPSKDKRKVTVDLTFEQDEQREDVQVIINVKTKLSSTIPSKTKFYVGKDLDTGEVEFQEYGNKDTMKGQMEMNQETGELEEVGSKNLRRFQKAQ